MRRSLLVIPILLLACDSSTTEQSSAVPQQPLAEVRKLTKVIPNLKAIPLNLASVHAPALHNPRSQSSYQLTCFEGHTDSPGGGFLGVCQIMQPTGDGAEVNTRVQGVNGSYAGVTQAGTNFIKGRLLKDVRNLNFSYAGGPHQGGIPRFSVPIDEDNDGTWENFAFADAPGCNNGDEFVGRVSMRADPSCNINYESVDYPNWNAFATAFPLYRIARDAISFIILDQAAHYLIWRVQIN